jgi:hypothetical protein
MLDAPASLVSLAGPWADFYSDSHLAQTLVTFAHVGALVVGGGIAIATDRATLRVASDVEPPPPHHHHAHVHRVVVGSLVVIVISGLLLFTSDLDANWTSPIFWVKMALIVALLANGLRMRRIEAAATADTAPSSAHWSALRGTAITSLALWLAITLLGVALVNYA